MKTRKTPKIHVNKDMILYLGFEKTNHQSNKNIIDVKNPVKRGSKTKFDIALDNPNILLSRNNIIEKIPGIR